MRSDSAESAYHENVVAPFEKWVREQGSGDGSTGKRDVDRELHKGTEKSVEYSPEQSLWLRWLLAVVFFIGTAMLFGYLAACLEHGKWVHLW